MNIPVTLSRSRPHPQHEAVSSSAPVGRGGSCDGRDIPSRDLRCSAARQVRKVLSATGTILTAANRRMRPADHRAQEVAMIAERNATQTQAPWERETTGPATLNEVITEVEAEVASGGSDRLRPMPTGFTPLDDVLNGGLRPGELLVIGGAFGVGKTIWGLQVARNVVQADRSATAMYICYEHDRAHLLSRLLCLESAEAGFRDDALTLRKIGDLSLNAPKGVGLVSRLQRTPRYATLVDTMHSYGDRLTLVKASGDASTLSGDTALGGECRGRGLAPDAGRGRLPAEDPGRLPHAGGGDGSDHLPDAGPQGARDGVARVGRRHRRLRPARAEGRDACACPTCAAARRCNTRPTSA